MNQMNGPHKVSFIVAWLPRVAFGFIEIQYF